MRREPSEEEAVNPSLHGRRGLANAILIRGWLRGSARDRDEHDYEVNREALERLARLEEDQGRIRELLVDLSVRTGSPGRARQSSGEMEPTDAATLPPDEGARPAAEGHARERGDA